MLPTMLDRRAGLLGVDIFFALFFLLTLFFLACGAWVGWGAGGAGAAGSSGGAGAAGKGGCSRPKSLRTSELRSKQQTAFT